MLAHSQCLHTATTKDTKGHFEPQMDTDRHRFFRQNEQNLQNDETGVGYSREGREGRKGKGEGVETLKRVLVDPHILFV